MYLGKLICLVSLLVFSRTEANKPSSESKHSHVENNRKAELPKGLPKGVLPSCVCGVSNIPKVLVAGEINNGQEVSPKFKYPWTVLVKKQGKAACGGTLINTKFVLTAATCVAGSNATTLQVVMGIHNISKAAMSNPTDLTDEPFAINRSVSKVKLHKSNGTIDDIALLKLSEPVTFSDQIKPVCLPKQASNHSLPPIDANIAGWGTMQMKNLSDVLREAIVNAYSSQSCQDSSYGNKITNNMLCSSTKGKEYCKNDLGGPLVYRTNNAYMLLGISSFGDSCGLKNFPGVYTRVSAFTDWIYMKTKGGKYCQNPNNGF